MADFNPAHFATLQHTRRMIAQWRDSIESVSSGEIRVRTNNIDTSDAWVADLEGLIARNQALVDHYDPDGLTALPPDDDD